MRRSDLICNTLEIMSLPPCTFKAVNQANILFFIYKSVGELQVTSSLIPSCQKVRESALWTTLGNI